MPLRPCPNTSNCPGTDEPISNYSSEAIDLLDFLSNQFFGAPPPLLQNWTAIECGEIFTSTVSQEDADMRALAAANNCVVTHQFPNPPPTQTLVYNTAQSCSVACPDGTDFSFTVPAGLFVGTNQLVVNQQALAQACIQAKNLKFCLGDIPQCICVGKPFSATIGVTPPQALKFSLQFGTLPIGLQLSSTGVISGTPVVAAQFTFTVLALSSNGAMVSKAFTMNVADITPSILPNCTVGTPYSSQLAITSCGSSNQFWQVASGTLPAGLTLNPVTGQITGTPIGPSGVFTFTVQFQD